MILQRSLPLKPWMDERTRHLPGLSPISTAHWLAVDEVFASQLALRERLMDERRAKVYEAIPQSENAATELLACLVNELPSQTDPVQTGYEKRVHGLQRPDGKQVDLHSDEPLCVAGRLVQEDLLILEKHEKFGTYILTAGILCFPASWTLSEKIGRPLDVIHKPVASYSDDIAKRVTRIFDGIRSEQPLMRANFLIYTDPDLFQPRREREEKPIIPGLPRYVRVERQTLRRLPDTGAIVFAIHTYIVAAQSLSSIEFAQLASLQPELCE